MALLLVVLGYLAGSIPFGVLLAQRLRGIDVRKQGSGNIGATNVARVAGKKLGMLVLVLDALKAAIPVLATTWLQPDAPMLHALVALAAFLGHVFPVWLRFRGGKGVATALGCLLVLAPVAALYGVAAYGLVFAATRTSSLGSLLAGMTALAASFLTARLEYALLTCVLFALMLFTHRANIVRIARRAERRL